MRPSRRGGGGGSHTGGDGGGLGYSSESMRGYLYVSRTVHATLVCRPFDGVTQLWEEAQKFLCSTGTCVAIARGRRTVNVAPPPGVAATLTAP